MDSETSQAHHYVCSECGYTSRHSGVCQTEDCMQEGVALKMCSCEDGLHTGVMNRQSPADDSAIETTGSTSTPTIDLDSPDLT